MDISRTSTASSTANPCFILDKLPPELRLHIYDQVYNDRYECSVIFEDGYCWMLLRVTNKAPEERGPLGHLLALLMVCKTFHNEAAPVLREATTFELTLVDSPFALPPLSKHRSLGPLKECVALKRIKKVGSFQIYRKGATTSRSMARYIDQVTAILPSDSGICMLRITLGLGKTSNKEADHIFASLMALNVRAGATLNLGEGFRDGWHEDSASSDVCRELVAQCGIEKVIPTDWHAREPGWDYDATQIEVLGGCGPRRASRWEQ